MPHGGGAKSRRSYPDSDVSDCKETFQVGGATFPTGKASPAFERTFLYWRSTVDRPETRRWRVTFVASPLLIGNGAISFRREGRIFRAA